MSYALTAARRTVDYVKAMERELRRLRRDREQLESALLAAKTAAAHLREALAASQQEAASWTNRP